MTPEREIELLKQFATMEPIAELYSMHVYEERYVLHSVPYCVYYEIGAPKGTRPTVERYRDSHNGNIMDAVRAHQRYMKEENHPDKDWDGELQG